MLNAMGHIPGSGCTDGKNEYIQKWIADSYGTDTGKAAKLARDEVGKMTPISHDA